MRTEYKRDMNHNYLIVYGENEINTDSYQVRMLAGNVIPSLLKCRIQGMDGRFFIYFDITSKQAVNVLYEEKKMGVEDLRLIFGGFVKAMEDAAEYLINPGQFIMSPEYIYTDIEKSEQFGNYINKLDAISFNEGFAHLVSYNQQEINSVEWEKLEDIYIQSINKMKLALMETNPQSQEQYIYEANFGNYYDKYACMCGMIYLAKEWQLGGYARLKEVFDQGYHGFARKCI